MIDFMDFDRGDTPFLNMFGGSAVRVGDTDRYGRTRIEDSPPVDPDEWDFAKHMVHIYQDIRGGSWETADEDTSDLWGDGASYVDPICSAIAEWADGESRRWEAVARKMGPQVRWDRDLTDEERNPKTMHWGMGDGQGARVSFFIYDEKAYIPIDPATQLDDGLTIEAGFIVGGDDGIDV